MNQKTIGGSPSPRTDHFEGRQESHKKRPFEITTRLWENWADALDEDYYEGGYLYLKVSDIIQDLKRYEVLQVDEKEDCVVIKGGSVFKDNHYVLAGRPPEGPRSNYLHEDNLQPWEVVRTIADSDSLNLGENNQPDYESFGRIGLYKKDGKILVPDNMVNPPSGLMSILETVVAKNFLEMYVAKNMVIGPGYNEPFKITKNVREV